MFDDYEEITRLFDVCDEFPTEAVPPPDFWAETFALISILDFYIDRHVNGDLCSVQSYAFTRAIFFRRELDKLRYQQQQYLSTSTHAANTHQI